MIGTKSDHTSRLALVSFFLAASLIAFEVFLMRVLLITHWHHFAFLFLSAALLGFGASGSFLFLAKDRSFLRKAGALRVLLYLTSISIPLSFALSQQISLSANFLPVFLQENIISWTLFWLTLCLPFFLGATALGITLQQAGDGVSFVYAANSLGSAAGGLLALVSMNWVDPVYYSVIAGFCAVISAAFTVYFRSGKTEKLLLAAGLLAMVIFALFPVNLRYERFKYRNFLSDLESQGTVNKIAESISHRAKWEAFEGNVFHEQMFLTTGANIDLPSMIALVRNGNTAGALLKISSLEKAGFLRNSLRAVAYNFIPHEGDVALFNETGGSNIWLALLYGSKSVAVINPNPALFQLILGPLRKRGGEIFADKRVSLYAEDPRHFVETSGRHFDLIQLAGMEYLTAGGSSFLGLNEDNLLTIEGLQRTLERLSRGGILYVCQGIEVPPRENLKFLNTVAQAIRRLQVEEPGRHVVQFRDFLGFCTMVRKTAWEAGQIDQLRRILKDLNLTPVWFPGITPSELNQPDQMPGPEGFTGDWHAFSARQVFSQSGQSFVNNWSFNVEPGTDEKPFFFNFLRWSAIGQLRRVYGPLWLTRTEVSLLFVLAAIAVVSAASLFLIVVPAALASGRAGNKISLIVVSYFASIGMGYMLFEMVLISRISRIMGDPLTGPALTITFVLLFSALGNLHSRYLRKRWPNLCGSPLFFAIIAAASVTGWIASSGSFWPEIASTQWKVFLAALLIAPPAYLMGFPMPLGIFNLEGDEKEIALAWGANGFASVLAPPLALAVAMNWGYWVVLSVAAVCYALSGIIWSCLSIHKS